MPRSFPRQTVRPVYSCDRGRRQVPQAALGENRVDSSGIEPLGITGAACHHHSERRDQLDAPRLQF